MVADDYLSAVAGVVCFVDHLADLPVVGCLVAGLEAAAADCRAVAGVVAGAAVFLMVMLLFLFCSFKATQADLTNQIYKFRFHVLGLAAGNFRRFQLLGYGALCVELFDLAHPFNSNRLLFIAIRKNVPHQVLENVFFDEGSIAFANL